MTGLLSNRTILITGSTSGIGKQLAIASAKEGANLILLSRKEKKLDSVVDEISALGLSKPDIIPLDLLNLTPEAAQSLSKQLSEYYPCIDVLLHNAALFNGLSPIEQFSEQEWLKVLQVNLSAPFLLSKYLLPLLKKSTSGRILFTKDQQAMQGKAYWGAYSVTKWAQHGLAELLKEELMDNTSVSVESIDPGPCDTRIRAKVFTGSPLSETPLSEEKITEYFELLK